MSKIQKKINWIIFLLFLLMIVGMEYKSVIFPVFILVLKNPSYCNNMLLHFRLVQKISLTAAVCDETARQGEYLQAETNL